MRSGSVAKGLERSRRSVIFSLFGGSMGRSSKAREEAEKKKKMEDGLSAGCDKNMLQ